MPEQVKKFLGPCCHVYYNVYRKVYDMRTNVAIDDDMMQRAMALSNLKTKKDVIDSALREFVEIRSRKDLLDLRGQIQFAHNYDYKALREGRRDIG